MIDEKKLIEDLEEVFKEHYYRLNKSGLSNELKRFINLQDRVAKVIFDQPKLSLENKTSDKWIPCSYRLPKENGEYRVTVQYYKLSNLSKTSGKPKNEIVELCDGKWIKAKFRKVVAWM